MTESGGLKTTSVNDGAGRIYDLDAIRAFAMFLGIVLHVSKPKEDFIDLIYPIFFSLISLSNVFICG